MSYIGALVISLIFLAIWIVAYRFTYNIATSSTWSGIDAVPCAAVCLSGIAIIVIFFIGPCFSYALHVKDLGVVQIQPHVIHVYQERADTLKSMFADINANALDGRALSNTDSPISTLSEQISKALSDLAYERAALERAKMSIAKRRISIYGFIVRWLDDSDQK